MAELTRLVGSYKTMEKKGFAAIAINRGDDTEAQAAWIAFSKKWPFSVYKNGSVRDFELGGNPQVFVFNGSGKAVHSPGSSGDFMKIISSESAKARDWIYGGHDFPALGGQAKEMEARRNLGRLLKELADKAAEGEENEKKEAAIMTERLKKYAELTENRAARLIEDGRASEGLALLQSLAEQFKDSEIGSEAAAEVARNRSDAAFKLELDAEKMWKAMESAFFKVAPQRPAEDAEKWKSKNAAAIKSLKDKFEAMRKKCGETKGFQFYSKRAAWLGIE